MPVWKFRNTNIIYPTYNLLDSVLAARGLSFSDLSSNTRTPSPFQIPGMEQVARRIAQAVAHKEKVLIFGDYDCDGICSTLIMTRFLECCGALVDFHLPSRQDEGYGICSAHVERAVNEGFDLIVTVDNGITAFEAVETAQGLGIDLVVTDHHEPQDKIPNAPIANPKLIGSSCYREYSGAGVAYLTCCAVAQLLGRPEPEDFLDLVSLATVVDVCPLTGDNFVLARKGLLQMRNSLRPGLKALFNGNQYQITGRTMGWILGPHINAAGRFGDPLLAYNLLSAKTPEEAEPFADDLKKINTERKNVVEVIKRECLSLYDGSSFPLLASPDWPEGVVGIAAGRLVDAVSRPAAVGAVCGEEVRFSARSLGEFDLVEALAECQSQTGALFRFGGHKLAAGFSLHKRNIPQVKVFLNKYAQQRLQPEDQVQWIQVDVGLAAVPSPSEVAALDYLEPHGKDNPEPAFYIKDRAVDVKSGHGWTLVRLNSGLKFFTSQSVKAGEGIHAVLSLTVNEYKGFQECLGHAVDVRPFLCTRNDLLRQYFSWRQGEEIKEWAELVFQELGFDREGENPKTSLFLSPTFLNYGVVKEGRKR
ncbi:MAG: DHH family phosphoesterase [Syntrophaceticus sp.]